MIDSSLPHSSRNTLGEIIMSMRKVLISMFSKPLRQDWEARQVNNLRLMPLAVFITVSSMQWDQTPRMISNHLSRRGKRRKHDLVIYHLYRILSVELVIILSRVEIWNLMNREKGVIYRPDIENSETDNRILLLLTGWVRLIIFLVTTWVGLVARCSSHLTLIPKQQLMPKAAKNQTKWHCPP